MKVNELFIGLFVCVSLYACSSDESEFVGGEAQKVFTNDEAYINIRLADASSLTRATDDDSPYQYGTADEHSVKNAFFYFYDADGVFVSKGSAWNGGMASKGDPTNIEFNSNNVVVLKGLTKKNYPMYMVTVLNGKEDFEYGETIDEMEKALAGGIYTRIVDTDDNNNEKDFFIMSTTSFKHDDSDNLSGKYFVTEVKTDNFSLEPVNNITDTDNYVTVYVERLAAKVTLDVDKSSLTPVTVTGKDGDYYKIRATVAGEDNIANDNVTATEYLLVRFLGWKLNATANDSYIMKNINEDWTESGLGFAWNNPTDKRSFWGKSYNYGLTPVADHLDYVNLKDGLKNLADYAYCAENTNTSDIVTANFQSAVTSILLKAEVCDANGNPLDLVRFNGVLFKEESFLQYIINGLSAKASWNVWIETTGSGSTDKAYNQVNSDYAELITAGNGKVKVQLATLPDGVKLYSRTEELNGKYTYTEITDFTAINTALEKASAGAVGYKGGLMYYNIPIEHLNKTATATNGTIPEAKYGVVRNHHYVVKVNKLENVGKGIFDPDEEIIPDKDDNNDTYYVGANISILSWRLVEQSVGF